MANSNQKKWVNENQKASETITLRTTPENKVKLLQEAAMEGKTLSGYCERLLFHGSEKSDVQVTETHMDEMKKLYELLEQLLEKNSELQEQIKMIREQPSLLAEDLQKTESEKTAVENTATQQVSTQITNVSEVDAKQELIKMIVAAAPDNKKEQFEKQFKKTVEYRMKKKLSKSVEDFIYKSIDYSINVAAFLDTGN